MKSVVTNVVHTPPTISINVPIATNRANPVAYSPNNVVKSLESLSQSGVDSLRACLKNRRSRCDTEGWDHFMKLPFFITLLGTCILTHSATLTWNSITPSKIVSIDVPHVYDGTIFAGVNNLTVDGEDVKAFCVDLSDIATHKPLIYIPKSSSDVFGDEVASMLAGVWSVGYKVDMTPQEASVLQLSLWSVVYDQKYGGEGFHTEDYNSDMHQLLAAAHLEQKFHPDSLPKLVVYTSSVGQDFITCPAIIPEPKYGTFAIGIAMIGVLCVIRRKVYYG